jgi:hypothetical protein
VCVCLAFATELTPNTLPGKAIATIAMYIGVVLIAIPVSFFFPFILKFSRSLVPDALIV